MIKWKRRLYALLLRQVVGPFLDPESREKLHESIDFSFQEGTFSLVHVALSTKFLNSKVDLGPLSIKNARTASLAIRLSLVEGKAPENASSSIAWRAMNLGTTVSLVAHVEIEGLQVEFEPFHGADDCSVNAASDDADPEPAANSTKSTFSSYVDAALSSLQLTLNMTNCSIRICQPPSVPGRTQWLEFSMSSLTYHDMDASITPNSSTSEESRIILQKSLVWRGVSLAAGESQTDEKMTVQATNSVATVALAEGTGQILLRAVEYNSRESGTLRKFRAQQDIDVRLNQHVKVSLDETSLHQIASVLEGVRCAAGSDGKTSNKHQEEVVEPVVSAAEAGDLPEVGMSETELYTINGIMKKYEEARIMAARNEMRGGILVPANAFEEGGSGDGDSRTFDIFFDANDTSFSHYASMMKESILASREGGPSDNFVHTKIRVHVLGGAVKLLFRTRTSEATPCFGLEEYVLLTLDELNATSSLSSSRSEFSFHVSHLEIDDSQLPYNYNKTMNSSEKRKAEIGTLLRFSQPQGDETRVGGDLVVQPSCISFQVNIDSTDSKANRVDIELNLMPIDLMYRGRTLSNLTSLVNSLGNSYSLGSNKSFGDNSQDRKQPIHVSARCTLSSLTVTIPALREHAVSRLYTRRGQSSSAGSLTNSAICVVLEELTLEFKYDGETGKRSESSCNLEYHNLLVYATSPQCPIVSVGSSQRLDILSATGRFEVEPPIPIALEYRSYSSPEGHNIKTGVATSTFPSVPPFSSFKARQEDVDEDEETDRILSGKFGEVNFDRTSLRSAKDPQSEMILEAENANALVQIHIPEVIFDLSSDELQEFLQLLCCCIPPTIHSETAGPSGSSSLPSVAISVACDTILCSMVNGRVLHGSAAWSSDLVRLDRCRAHCTVGGCTTQYMRLLSHETTFFHAFESVPNRCFGEAFASIGERVNILKIRATAKSNSSAVPIFYRSKIFPAISHGSPSVLFDWIWSESEQSVFVSVYDMTFRYAPGSAWFDGPFRFFSSLRLTPDDIDRADESTPTGGVASSLTKVFVSLADCNVDYISLQELPTASRSILRVGEVRFCSNIVTPGGTVQAYNISLGDLSYQLCNTRCPYNFENSLLPGASQTMSQRDLSSKHNPFYGSHPLVSTDYIFRMGFKTLLTLDSLRAVIVNTTSRNTTDILTEPRLTTSIAVGEVSLYACKDSFACFMSTVGELETKLSSFSKEDLEELKSQCQKISCNVCQSHGKLEATPTADSHVSEVVTVDAESNFLLDGYDWTTIDHDGRSDILPGEEQASRWYQPSSNSSPKTTLDSSRIDFVKGNPINVSVLPQIIDHHFPLHVGETEGPQCGFPGSLPANSRVVVHDLRLKVRLFDGYDWPQCQKVRKLDSRALFVIAEPLVRPASDSKAEACGRSKEEANNSKHLEGLLDGLNEKAGMFANMPLPEARALSIMSQTEARLYSRRTNAYIQLSSEGISMRIDSYPESMENRLKSCLSCSVKDFFLAETISSSTPVKMLGEWFNEMEHPRDTNDGLLMLRMLSWNPPNPLNEDGQIASDECEVSLAMAPVRCIVDQRAVKFAQAFFADLDGDDDCDAATAQDWAAELNLIPPPFVRKFRMTPVKLKIDYSPQKLDTAALKNGCVVELINLSPLDSMVLTLHPVEIKNVAGFGDAIDGLISHWLGDICATQMHKFLTNARPFEPFTNVGGGVVDLFLLPWDAYQNGDSVSRALRASLYSLLGTLAHETLTTSSRLTGFIAGEASKATSNPHAAGSKSHSTLPSRPLKTPRRLSDTAGHALESLARGVQTANYKVIIVPYREYRRSGTKGAIKSIVRGIPVAVAGPVGGVSESVSYALLGLRNQVRPDIRKEEEASQRGLRYGAV